jgi:DNA repair exonuclease SbcCD nuclease subunit
MKSNSTFQFTITSNVLLGDSSEKVLMQKDKFNSFRDYLSLSINQNSDFSILAGNLYSNSKPAANFTATTMHLLQKNVLCEE